MLTLCFVCRIEVMIKKLVLNSKDKTLDVITKCPKCLFVEIRQFKGNNIALQSDQQ